MYELKRSQYLIIINSYRQVGNNYNNNNNTSKIHLILSLLYILFYHLKKYYTYFNGISNK